MTPRLFTDLLAASEPAGGAAIGQVVIATAFATIATAGLLWLLAAHRSGRTQILERIGAFSERVSGLPAWAALPAGLGGGALLIALLGMYWDISLHIDQGRDPGPLANPAHYLILFGLYGVLAGGFTAMVLAEDPLPKSAVRLVGDWRVSLGGLLITCCGAFSLLGFPLDDVW